MNFKLFGTTILVVDIKFGYFFGAIHSVRHIQAWVDPLGHYQFKDPLVKPMLPSSMILLMLAPDECYPLR